MANPSTFGTARSNWLARIDVLGGQGDHPCYMATLRAALRLPGDATQETVKKTVGVRSLVMSTMAETVNVDPHGSVQLHAPLLLRLHPAAHQGNGSNVLEIAGMRGILLPAAGHDYGDLLVTPASADWPDQYDPDVLPGDWEPAQGENRQEISVPAFRVRGGGARHLLRIDDGSKLAKLLQARATSLLGGLAPVTHGKKAMPVTLVAEGVEFAASLPDPTRACGGQPDARIAGNFRLEYDPRRSGGGYYLRLVGHEDGGRPAMDALEARIGAAFADLAQESGSPLAISLDRRPTVPPLLWPLERKGDTLALVPASGAPDDFEMEIDRAALTVRLRTRSDYAGEAAGLAAVLVERVAWIATAAGFDLRIGAGSLGSDRLSLAFAKSGDAPWSTSFTATSSALPVTVPLHEHGQRMAELYRQSRLATPAGRDAPYLYFPVVDGWLQLALPAERTGPAPQQATPPRDSVMSGKIVAGTGLGRGVRILDATALALTMQWEGTPGALRARRGLLQISGAQAIFQGFLYASETSPTAAEALPDLRRGPAATRDLAIHLGAGPQRLELTGAFGWDAHHNTWKLDVDRIRGSNLEPAALSNYAWLPAAANPFISNHPLTRTVASAAEPSVSRGLLPIEFGQAFSLHLTERATLPVLKPKGPLAWAGVFGSKSAGFRDDTLLLPTLAGVEFCPGAPGTASQIEAALRFDLPLLDELFAWSDPPREKEREAGAPAPDPAPVTSLDMDALQASWRANRIRIALTRTQSAFATAWRAVGATHAIEVAGLVEPYSWKTTFCVDLVTHLHGRYSLGGTVFTPERAVAGLDEVAFKPVGTTLLPDAAGAIRIAGFAAGLFAEGADRIWDSRGFGMAPAGGPSGRPASQRYLDAATPPALVHRDFVLFTMSDALAIPRDKVAQSNFKELDFAADLRFHARDLALTKGIFDGSKNQTESAAGATGQAYLSEAMPDSLHEWRFFEAPGADDLLRHDIGCGPFRFKPLRLLRAEFDQLDGLRLLRVVGSMRLDLDPALSRDKSTPFGPDEVYRGGDLFELSLERATPEAAWSCTWRAVSARPDADTGLVTFASRAGNGVNCAVLLEPVAKGIRSDGGVPATIAFDLEKGAATLSARLFGNTALLRCPKYVVDAVGITLDLAASLPAPPPAPHLLPQDGVWLVDVAPTVTIARSGSTLRIDGALVVMAAAGTVPARGAALAVFGDGDWRWLDLVPGAGVAPGAAWLTVNHRTGVLSGSWNSEGSGSPVFGMKHTGFVASGRIEAIAAAVPLLENGRFVAMASAWMRASSVAGAAGDGQAIVDHRLRRDPDASEHVLDLSGTLVVRSPIQWPLDGLFKGGATGEKLHPADDPWVDPGQGKAPLDPRSRLLTIGADAPVARHCANLRLSRHRIAAAQLCFTQGVVTVRESVRLLAVVTHTLHRKARRATWTSLDYVTITTAAAVRAAASVRNDRRWYYFAPRYKTGLYRKKHNPSVTRPGVVPMPLALAGFYDPLMIEELWQRMPQHTPLILGGAALQLRLDAGTRSLLAVMPWMHLPGADHALTQKGGTWHMPAQEMWSGHALESMESVGAIGLPSLVTAPALAERLGAAGLTAPVRGKSMADALPVEQAWFEKWAGAATPMGDGDLERAPFFLRTLLVVARRWQHDEARQPSGKRFTWDVASFLPCRTDTGRNIPNNEGPALIRVEIRDSTAWQAPYREPVSLVPADLTVLSRSRAIPVPGYRLITQTGSAGLETSATNAVLVARALEEDRAALLAVQEAFHADGTPAVTPVHLPTGLDDWLAPPGSDIRRMPELLPSAALGWPSGAGLRGLDRLGPRLGAELPVLAPGAGFSARFQRFGWPAVAVGDARVDDERGPFDVPEAFYLSFANRIAYDRPTQLDFKGPPARHLMPAPVRRRAPLNASMHDTLDRLAGGAGHALPLLLPAIERATIGRRPGVFEVVHASLTVPGDSGEFDPSHPRFGRPGNSGPVAAHQLRTPRSPLLPGDDADDTVARDTDKPALAFRRRTYLSEADRDKDGNYALFKTFGGNTDVLRIGTGDDQVRVALALAGSGKIGPVWDGTIAVALQARNRAGEEGGNDIAGLKLDRKAWIDIGYRQFELTPTAPVAPATFSWECRQLADARETLRAASVDTPIRVVFGLLKKSETSSGGALAEAVTRHCSIALALDPGMRSVLPVGGTTLAFGDPSYDRQLASPTAMDQKDIEDAQKVRRRLLLSADRKQYDPAAILYFAFGETDRESGLFASAMDGLAPTLSMMRARPGTRPEDPPVTVPLVLRDTAFDAPPERYKIEQGTPYALPLSSLAAPGDDSGSAALLPDDRLLLSVWYGVSNALQIAVDIVAEPVIAPAPSVYSVIGTDHQRKVMSVVLHAAGPLPQRIEFDDIKRDLALGQVRRRALFIWCWASVGTGSASVDLVKFDRSGGAQLP